MKTVFNFVDKATGRSVTVEWDGGIMFKSGPVQVFQDQALLGEFGTMDEIKMGKTFKTANSENVQVIYQKVFWFISAINVYLNGNKIKGSQLVTFES